MNALKSKIKVKFFLLITITLFLLTRILSPENQSNQTKDFKKLDLNKTNESIKDSSTSSISKSENQNNNQNKIDGLIINKGLWLVDKKIITSRDLDIMEKKLKRIGKLSKNPKNKHNKNQTKSAKDHLIERALVEGAAEENTIIVSKEKLNNEIQRRMQYLGLNEKQFQKKMEKDTGLNYFDWVNDLEYELLKRQLIQLSLNVSPPEMEDVKKYYIKNKSHIGIEISYREIILLPSNNSLQEESRISNIATNLYQKILRGEATFIELAKREPNNVSPFKYNGGLKPAQSIYDIAAENPILANILYSSPMYKALRPFRDSLNRYMLVQVEKKHPLPLEKVRVLILNQLYAQKEEAAFEKWITKRKKEVVIKKLEN